MTDSRDLRPETFHKFEVFDGLNADEIRNIAACTDLLDLDSGEVFLSEGSRDRDMYGMLTGRAEVLTTDDLGETRKLAEVRPHAVMGELGLAVGAPRSATVRTVEPTELLRIDGDGFHELQTEHSSVAYKVEHNILRILARRIEKMNRQLLPGRDA